MILPFAFIAPCLPIKAPRPPTGALWVHEIKHDGFRIIARKDGRRVRLYSRVGNDLTDRFPLIVEALGGLRSRSVTLDGEAVACDDNGMSNFDRLRHRVPAARSWADRPGPRPAPRCRGAHAAGGRSCQRAISRHDNSAGSAPPDRAGWSCCSPRRGLATDRTGTAAQELTANERRAATFAPVAGPAPRAMTRRWPRYLAGGS